MLLHRRWSSFGSTTSRPPSLLQAGCTRLSTRLNFERIRTGEVKGEISNRETSILNDCACDKLRPPCRFWALLADYLCVHQLASPLPFTSSFCQGFGSSFFSRGQVLKALPHLHAQTASWKHSKLHFVFSGKLRSSVGLNSPSPFPAAVGNLPKCIF